MRQGEKIDSQGARLEAQITEIKAEIKAQTSRIDVLQRGDLARDLVRSSFCWPRLSSACSTRPSQSESWCSE